MAKEKEQLESLTGSVEDIVFHNEETGFTVMELDAGDELVTVVGKLLSPAPGEEIEARGSFVNHPTFGSQFKALLIERKMPAGANAIRKYLSSGVVKGIGPATARRLVELFGDDTLEVLEKDPMQLVKIKGISPKKAEEIAEEYKRIFGIRTVMAFLDDFNIEATVAINVWKFWGAGAIEIIKMNPYALCIEEIGLGFYEADEIAGKLGMDPDSRERLAGGLLHVLRHNLQNGHCCLPYEKLLRAGKELLQAEEEPLDEALLQLVEEEELITETVEGQIFVFLPELYQSETYVAGRLRMMLMTHPFLHVELEKEIDQLERELNISYAKLQRKAISYCMSSNLLILTGGPGTGKTTTLNGIIKLLEDSGNKVGLVAPTGRAAKRMTELTGREAKTIHRMLEVEFADDTGLPKFRRNAKNPLPYDAVVVDEMSMVDISLFASLLQAMRVSAKLIMVGDPDQLPSVGPGNVLRDLMDSDVIPMVHLSEVFRQAAESLIVVNAHAIVGGELPDLKARDNDFFFMPASDQRKAAQTVVQLLSTRLPAAYGYSPQWDIQVITPSRVGQLGTMELNRMLQEAINPPDPAKVEYSQAGLLLREGDKVMQIKNNYDIVWANDDGQQGTGIFNGDIGVIEMIDRPSRSIHIRFEDRVAEYLFDNVNELELAYAVTVHKSQGSEFEAVVMPLMGNHRRLYYRNLLYTGVTRAKRLLVMVGEPQAVQQMVENDYKTLRYTCLKEFIKES